MKTYLLDTNVALRFLLADDPQQSPKAKALFALAEAGKIRLRISHIGVAELVWVLHSFFNFERAQIATTLRGLLLHDGVEVDGLDTMLGALDHFGRIKVDFPDCYLATLSANSNSALVSYDRDFRKFSDVTCVTPDELLKP
ncbi:MAG: PIN domain-containing protein [Verrucomicrobiota bacterium]